MKILKNIKYKGIPYKKGENVDIDKKDIRLFAEKGIIANDLSYNDLEYDISEEIYNAEEFVPGANNPTKETETEEKEPIILKVDIDNISKDKIIEILKQKEINHNPRDKKEVLYNLMIEGE